MPCYPFNVTVKGTFHVLENALCFFLAVNQMTNSC